MHGERSSQHRGARAILVAAVFAFAALANAAPRPVWALGAGPGAADSALVILSGAFGAQRVDLPGFGTAAGASNSIGWRPQASFALGVVLRRWCEPFAELSYTYLPGPDSVRVVSLGDSVFADLGTLTQVQAGVLIRPWAMGSWQSYVRLGAGVARLSVASPARFESRATDALWSAGGGLEWWARRHLVVRGEGRYTGQAATGGTRSHLALQLAVGYAFGQELLAPASSAGWVRGPRSPG